MVPPPVEGDGFLGEEQPQDLNLLLAAAATVAEVLIQGLVLDVVPPDPDPQTESAAREHIHLGRLLGDQDSLALRQDEDTRDELQALGKAGQIAEQHEWLVEKGTVRI